MKTCIIFGGTGFIGSHFALHLSQTGEFDDIVLADIAPIRRDFQFDARVRHVAVDVRLPIEQWPLPDRADLIANFAAVHREPGHANNEYYETNLPGAENVCAWAEKVQCRRLIFTSSIAPYGPSEEAKTEVSIPTPVSGYGGSKLAAEKIHQAWQRAAAGRRLVIVRPGVVFGPGERGNVTRLVQATLRHYFFYMGNRQTRKAGGYVKELVNTMLWALARLPETGGAYLYNFTMPQPPTVQEYVETTTQVAGVTRWIPSFPFRLLLMVSYAVEMVARPLLIQQPISPVRVRKLIRSNNIVPAALQRDGYAFLFTLEKAMADWKRNRPDEWR